VLGAIAEPTVAHQLEGPFRAIGLPENAVHPIAFVLALMIYVMWRFRESANPTPSKNTHHVGLEVAWTVVPIFILLIIAIPSFKLLYMQYNYPKPDVTIKAVGNAWYWDHEYLDHKGISITSNMLTDEDVIKAEIGDKAFNERFGKLEDGSIEKSKILYDASKAIWAKRANEPRQLAVDNVIAVPVNKVVHMLVTSTTSSIRGRSRRSAPRCRRSRAASTRRGSARPRPASSTASARCCAVRTTRVCRSLSPWSASRPTASGLRRLRPRIPRRPRRFLKPTLKVRRRTSSHVSIDRVGQGGGRAATAIDAV
jgi:hypothetical protein